MCVFGYKLYIFCRWISSGLFSLHLAAVCLSVMEGEKKHIFKTLVFLSHVSHLLLSLIPVQQDGMLMFLVLL